MTAPNLEVELCGIKFRNPILTASGTFGYGEEFNNYIDLSCLGGIVTKSITREPRPGHPPPRTYETTGGMINAIGLANVGVDRFVSEKIPFLKTLDTRIIVNVAGFSIEEYRYCVERLNDAEAIDMLEINISCPNVGAGGLEFSSTEKGAFAITSELKKISRYPLMIKLSPNVTDISAIARAAEEGGADCLSLINTLVGMGVNHWTFKPILTNITGGLSGPAIKPVALAKVWQVHNAVKIPLVGIGGALDHFDVAEFMIVGASLVQFGTANFINPDCTVKASEGLVDYLDKSGIDDISQLIGKLGGNNEVQGKNFPACEGT
ncbi:MAG: dihydroorotate dehydrogenase [candidate division Zixibacteria bacterium]|nr:dihydroorotate dehydrogenase [candidate division Zixibacteria bacterium]